jgi:hypothetical protein
MTFDEWLTTIPIQQTPQGARLELSLYVHPDGHGNVCVEDEQGRSVGKPQPVNDSAEARDVLEKIWNRAMKVQAAPTTPTPAPRRTLAEQLGDLIGSVPELPPDMAEHHDHYLHGAPKE